MKAVSNNCVKLECWLQMVQAGLSVDLFLHGQLKTLEQSVWWVGLLAGMGRLETLKHCDALLELLAF